MSRLSTRITAGISPSPAAIAIVLLGALLTGYYLTMINTTQALALIFLLIVFVCTFVWPEAGLYLVIFSMLLSPEIIVGEMGGKATLGRGLTLRLEDFLLVVIGLSWFARTAVDKTLGLFRKTPLNQPIAFYILACLVATLWGRITGSVQGKAGFFFLLKYFEYMIVFWIVVNYVNTAEQAKRLLFCLFLTCFIVSVSGLMQIPGGGRVSAPFEGEIGEPNTLGGYLVFMGAVAVALMEHLKDLRMRLGLAMLLVVLLISLLYTQSRASYLAVIPAYLVLAIFSKRRLYMIAGLIILLTLSPFVFPRVVKERIAFTFTQSKEPGQIQFGNLRLDTSASARIMSWQEALSDWRKKPILGYGVTGHGFMDSQYPRILVETGIVGMLAFVWLVCSLFQIGLRTLKKRQNDILRGLAVGMVAGLVGLLVHAMAANTFIIVRIMEPFWCLTGIFVALSAMAEESEQVSVR